MPHPTAARWPHAAFHTTCAVVGAGVLGLPASLARLGPAPGLAALSALGAASVYTSWQLAQLHEHSSGRRLNSYRELGQAAWGARAGWWAVVPVQTTLMVGLCVTYTVTAAQSLKGAASAECAGADCATGLAPWAAAFGAAQLLLSQVPDFHSLWWVSAAGAAMSVGYCSVAAGAAVAAAAAGPPPPFAPPPAPAADRFFGVLNALGSTAFVFGGQVVLPEIQATLARPPPTPRAMMRGVAAAYVVVAAAYYSVAISGYLAFGAAVQPDVLLSLSEPAAAVAAANLMVVLHVAAAYQVFAMPVFASLEEWARARLYKGGDSPRGGRRAWALRAGLRGGFVLATTLAAIAVPFFGELMGLIAAVGLIPITFVIPPLLWLTMRRPKGAERAANVALAGACSLLAALALAGSVRNIAVSLAARGG